MGAAEPEPEPEPKCCRRACGNCNDCYDYEQWRLSKFRQIVSRMLSHVEECGCTDADACPHPFVPGIGHARFTAGADSALPELLEASKL